jgi:hypothetical protein
VTFLNSHFSLQLGQVSGPTGAVTRNPQLPHFQYVSPHPGQISPEKSPGKFMPQFLHAFASLIIASSVFRLTGSTILHIFYLEKLNKLHA